MHWTMIFRENDQIVRCCIFLIFFCRFVTTDNVERVGRKDHTANYIDGKIYFLGGGTEAANYTNDFFYLDVSAPFNTLNDLPIVDLTYLTNNAQIPNHARATSSVCGPNKDTIFLYGGDTDTGDNSTELRAFNINSQWHTVVHHGDKPTIRRWSAEVCDKNSKIYIFGGTTANYTTELPFAFSNELDVFDTIELTWSVGKLDIPPMDVATATLLSDGKIVYLGGNTAIPVQYVNMSEIYIFDTIIHEWSQMSTVGIIPAARGLHTAVLTQDGRIIVYGGENPQNIPAPDPLSVLDTTVQPFSWSIPAINFSPSLVPFRGHTATLVGNYMIVAYGLVYNGTASVHSNQILMLDVSDKDDYKWITNFTLNTGVSNAPDFKPPLISKNRIISIGIICALVLIISGFIIFLFYRLSLRYRKYQFAKSLDH